MEDAVDSAEEERTERGERVAEESDASDSVDVCRRCDEGVNAAVLAHEGDATVARVPCPLPSDSDAMMGEAWGMECSRLIRGAAIR